MRTPLKKPTHSQNTSPQGEAGSPVSSDGAAETARGHRTRPPPHPSITTAWNGRWFDIFLPPPARAAQQTLIVASVADRCRCEGPAQVPPQKPPFNTYPRWRGALFLEKQTDRDGKIFGGAK